MSISEARKIISTVFPYAVTAAQYSLRIQPDIAGHASKESSNSFGAALSDADLSIQCFFEVLLLARFPKLKFYGEEYASSLNTKYLAGTEFGESNEILALLDPIDGTRFYLDRCDNFQVIFGLATAEEYLACLAISPGMNRYYVGIKGEGLRSATLNVPLARAEPLMLEKTSKKILLGLDSSLHRDLLPGYEIMDVDRDYSISPRSSNLNGILKGELGGCITSQIALIDGLALLFLAEEGGAIVTDHFGNPLPAPGTAYKEESVEGALAHTSFYLPGAVAALTPEMHRDILSALSGER